MQPIIQKMKSKLTTLANWIIPLLTGMLLLGCSEKYQAFESSHDSIRTGMSLRRVFESGLADYLIRMKNKNIPGGTLLVKQPVSNACKRHVLEVSYSEAFVSGAFLVRVYCGMNEPSSPQVIPEKSFKSKEEFLQALDTTYASFASSMEFRVESPPRRMFGVYDHFTFTTNDSGMVTAISTVKRAP